MKFGIEALCGRVTPIVSGVGVIVSAESALLLGGWVFSSHHWSHWTQGGRGIGGGDSHPWLSSTWVTSGLVAPVRVELNLVHNWAL